FFMRRYGYPVAPMVIGLILGPMFEAQLRRALSISQGDPVALVQSPFALVVYVALVAIFLLSALLKRRQRRLEEVVGEEAAQTVPTATDERENACPSSWGTSPPPRGAPPWRPRWRRPGCARSGSSCSTPPGPTGWSTRATPTTATSPSWRRCCAAPGWTTSCGTTPRRSSPGTSWSRWPGSWTPRCSSSGCGTARRWASSSSGRRRRRCCSTPRARCSPSRHRSADRRAGPRGLGDTLAAVGDRRAGGAAEPGRDLAQVTAQLLRGLHDEVRVELGQYPRQRVDAVAVEQQPGAVVVDRLHLPVRSEEHTSEL